MMLHIKKTVLLAMMTAIVTGVSVGQSPTYTITPDTAPAGTARVIELTNGPLAPISVQSTFCLWTSIHTGGPGGPLAPVLSPFCLPASGSLQPCGTTTQNWTPPAVLAPGTYWMKCQYVDATGAIVPRWVDFRIDATSEPTLTPVSPPQVGQTWALILSHPADPNSGYVAGASLSTDQGIALPGLPLTLDQDLLFNLSFPVPHPGLFTDFQGVLDANGNAALFVHIPPIAGIACFGIHVQSVLINSQNALELSNCIDAVIQ